MQAASNPMVNRIAFHVFMRPVCAIETERASPFNGRLTHG